MVAAAVGPFSVCLSLYAFVLFGLLAYSGWPGDHAEQSWTCSVMDRVAVELKPPQFVYGNCSI